MGDPRKHKSRQFSLPLTFFCAPRLQASTPSSQPDLRYGKRERFGEEGAPIARGGIGCPGVQIGWVMKTERSEHVSSRVRSLWASPVECSSQAGAKDSSAPLLGRQYPDPSEARLFAMKIVKRDARTLCVSWVASGITQHGRTWSCRRSALLARLTPASATQLAECVAIDLAIRRNDL